MWFLEHSFKEHVKLSFLGNYLTGWITSACLISPNSTCVEHINMSIRGISSFILFFILLVGYASAGYETHFTIVNAANTTILRTDVNGDGVVNILDISMVAAAWSSYPRHPKWDVKLDINDYGIINIMDIVFVARDFGKIWLCYDFDEPLDRNVWNVISGNWDTLDGWLEGTADSEGLIYARNTMWKDYTLSANVKIAADSPRAEAAFCFFHRPRELLLDRTRLLGPQGFNFKDDELCARRAGF